MMTTKRKILVQKDGRSKSSKGQTARHNIQMDDKIITLFQYVKDKSGWEKTKSRNWYARCYLGGKTRQKNTKTDDLKTATKFAKKWYGTMLSKLDDGIPTERIHRDDHLFDELAMEWLDLCKKVACDCDGPCIKPGHRYKHYYKDHYLSYKNYIQPFFINDYVEQVNTPRLLEWTKWRETKRIKSPDLPQGRLKKEYTVIFQILQMGVDKGFISGRPEKPLMIVRQMGTQKKPPSRATFTSSEYKKLLQVSRRRVKDAKEKMELQKKLKDEGNGKSFGGGWENIYRSRLYLHYYIIFLAHTGVRPYEMMRVRHKHIRMIDDKDDEKKHLEMYVIGKIRDRTIISKYGAFFSYRGICKNICPNPKGEDLLFPTNPYTGLLSLIEDAELRYSINGDKRDSKSLRHFYIMTELQRGTPIEYLTQQCDVSYAVIRDHYARHLQPKMFREQLIKVSHIEDP